MHAPYAGRAVGGIARALPGRGGGGGLRAGAGAVVRPVTVVRALPPTAAMVELRGVLGHHGTDARHLGEILRGRSVSHLGIDLQAGIGPAIADASAPVSGSGAPSPSPPGQVADRLGPLPVQARGLAPLRTATCAKGDGEGELAGEGRRSVGEAPK